jgi:hypothetical protein
MTDEVGVYLADVFWIEYRVDSTSRHLFAFPLVKKLDPRLPLPNNMLKRLHKASDIIIVKGHKVCSRMLSAGVCGIGIQKDDCAGVS